LLRGPGNKSEYLVFIVLDPDIAGDPIEKVNPAKKGLVLYPADLFGSERFFRPQLSIPSRNNPICLIVNFDKRIQIRDGAFTFGESMSFGFEAAGS
jgi:hypothetical protein